MEVHNVQTVIEKETNIYKDVALEYDAEYYYCDQADELYADEKQMSQNDIAMKNACREKKGLLTSHQIAAIRARYVICVFSWDGAGKRSHDMKATRCRTSRMIRFFEN